MLLKNNDDDDDNDAWVQNNRINVIIDDPILTEIKLYVL